MTNGASVAGHGAEVCREADDFRESPQARRAPRAAQNAAMPATSASHAAIEAALCRGRWFSDLPPDARRALLGAARPCALAAGDVLFRRGDANSGLYALLDGRLLAGAAVSPRRDTMLGVLQPPTWFGEVACLDDGVRTHDARAVTDARLLHVPLAAWQRLADADAMWWRHLGRLLAEKTRALFIGLEDLTQFPAPQRVARRLLAMSSGYGMLAESARDHRLEVSQDQLGAMLSLTRQTVSQVLGSFESAGWVRRGYGHLEIVDVAGLTGASRD